MGTKLELCLSRDWRAARSSMMIIERSFKKTSFPHSTNFSINWSQEERCVAKLDTNDVEIDKFGNRCGVWLSCYSGLMIPGARFSRVPKTFRARKTIREPATRLFCKAGLFICCKDDKYWNNCIVSCLETLSLWRYKENISPETRLKSFGTSDKRALGPSCSKGE